MSRYIIQMCELKLALIEGAAMIFPQTGLNDGLAETKSVR